MIAVLKAAGQGVRAIARQLGRSPSTICEELKRNSNHGRYVAIQAQHEYEVRRLKANRRNPLKNNKVYRYVEERLRDGWSPEQVEGRLKRDHPDDRAFQICKETIYQYIYRPENQHEALWDCLPRHLKKRRKQKGRKVHKSHIQARISIHKRPEIVNARIQFGHYEGDTVEGKGHRDGIHTEVERISRKFFARKVSAITSEEAVRAQKELFGVLPRRARRSTTLDNGRENHLHMKLKSLKMKTYFADPYSSWQRGSNEYHNGLLRRYLPKGTDFKTITQVELDEIVEEINNRPRKVLKYQTPEEVFSSYLKNCSDST